MAEPITAPHVLSDKGPKEIRRRATCSCCGENVHDFVDRLRPLVAAATEFTFRPDYGDVTTKFPAYENPEERDAITLSYRGPSEEGGDPDRWVITWRHHNCWSRKKQKFVHESSAGNRTDTFIADTRFTRAEALALVPRLLRQLQDVRIPELRRLVESWAEPAASAGQRGLT